MFQRIHKQKEPDDHLSQEGEGSVHGGGAGNEAALVNNLITNESNEANNTLIENLILDEENNSNVAPDSENEFRLTHYIENDIERSGLKGPNKKAKRAREKKPILFNEAKNAGLGGNNDRIYNDSPDYESGKNNILGDMGNNIISEESESSKEKEAVPKEIADEGLDKYYLNDLNRLDRKPGRKRENGTDLPLISEKDDKQQILSEHNQEDTNALIKNIVNENHGAGAGKEEEEARPSKKSGKETIVNLLEDVVDEDEKSSSSKGSKKSAKSKSSANAPADRIRNEDLSEAGDDMKPIDGWNFNATKLPARKTVRWWQKLFTRAAYYTGKSVGKIAGFLSHLFTGGWKFFARANARKINKAAPQEKRDHESIPGWEGAKWEGSEHRDKEPDIDFRRVPAIWSYPIAAKAEKAPDEPKDPVISIYVSQPRAGEDDLTVNEAGTGHSGIGIEFSRKSNVTGEWERYNLRFGFFSAGGIDPVASGSVMAYNRALIPGQLMNERGRPYDISRSYKINNQQVNAVLKAAETYPDKGYNSHTRNCTTFAKEMIVKYAHIPAGDKIFKKEALQYSAKQNFMLMTAGAFSMWGKAGMEQNLTKLTRGDDTNYQGYGNKRMTREEYDRYYNSLGFFRGSPLEADTPNGAAENMRRLEGKGRGTIGSFRNTNDSLLSPLAALTRLITAADDISLVLQQITPADKMEDEHYQNADKWVSGMGKSLIGINKFDEIKDKQKMQDVRAKLTEDIDNLNTVLFDYYKNDNNLHMPVMNAISILTNAIYSLDADYESFAKNRGKKDDELNNLRVSFRNTVYDISLGNGPTIEMTPSLYEAYLQVYKTPEAAFRALLRYDELSNLNEDAMTPDQKKELEKIGRKEALVREFEKSHRYMLEKQSFTQQDIDYAFGLEKKEHASSVAIKSEMFDSNKAASSTYKTLFLEKIFGGMKGRYRNYRDNPQAAPPGGKQLMMGKWLDGELLNCANSKKGEIKMILNSIIKSLSGNPDRDKLAYEFLYMLKGHWFKQLYDETDQETDEYRELETSYNSILKYGKFRKLLEELAEEVIRDNRKLNAERASVYSEDDDDD